MVPSNDAAIGYHAMRLRWCRLALVQFLRRWGVYLVVAALAAGAGSDNPGYAVAGVAAWTVMPLFSAARHGWWLLPGLLLQTLVGVACIWGLRSLLWPVRWREAEAALPIDPRARLRSDTIVVAVALLPLMLLEGAGSGAMLSGDHRGLPPGHVAALLALLLSGGLSLVLGVALLQRLRRHPWQGTRGPAARRASALAELPAHVGWLRVLLVLPLWRGPARRTGRLLAWGSAALCVPGLVLLVWPDGLGWMLAGLACAALALVTRLSRLAREEFDPLFQACTMLPLDSAGPLRARAALCLLPLLAALAALLPGLWRASLRPGVLVAYLLASAASCVIEVLAKPAEPADKASRWIFSLVLCVALASEVMP